MKKLMLLLLVIAVSAFTASAKKTTTHTTFYGEYANSDGKNPCKGETTRVCAEQITTIEEDDNGCKIYQALYDAKGNVINTAVSRSTATVDEVVADILSNTPANATVTVTDEEYAEIAD